MAQAGANEKSTRQSTMTTYFKRKSLDGRDAQGTTSKSKQPKQTGLKNDHDYEDDGEQSKTTTGIETQHETGGFQYVEKKGDLFTCPPSESLAHCISEDVRMGKGIATIFKRKFGGVQELISQGKKPGEVAVLRRDGRFVFYLVTKQKYWNKPTYDTLKNSLRATRHFCRQNNIKAISMPKIGCGLDGLQWAKVLAIIKEVFGDECVKITVYTL